MQNEKIAKKLQAILPFVEKPSRYIGGELGSITKTHTPDRLLFALVSPEPYELSSTTLSLQILYHIMNNQPWIACERAFAPWVDMSEKMRKNNIPLFSLETKTPLNKFDIIGFSIHYELSYPNIFEMLSLSGIPFYSRDRDKSYPLIIAGGSCAYQPEPIADIFDFIFVGDAEQDLIPILKTIKENKERDRKELLKMVAEFRGVYVPSLYQPKYKDNDFIGVKPDKPVKAAISYQLKSEYYPVLPPMPWTQPVHDRYAVEIMRGCSRGCRFCEAGFIYRPLRERQVDTIINQVLEGISNTGWETVNLFSLSTADYSGIDNLLESIEQVSSAKKFSVAMPSLRADSVTNWQLETLRRKKKSGLTFAPEAGTERMRRVINKPLDEEKFLDLVDRAFKEGWLNIKLYFMIGLPTETEQDIDGIIRLVKKVYSLKRNRRTTIKITISPFVPRPHTPFQWEGMENFDNLKQKMVNIKRSLNMPGIVFDKRDINSSLLECVLARGDRRLVKVLERVWRKGGVFASWQDRFNFSLWKQAFAEENLSMQDYLRPIDTNHPLYWDHIKKGVTKDFLKREHKRAYEEKYTPDCRVIKCDRCNNCEFEKMVIAQKKERREGIHFYGRSKKRENMSRRGVIKRRIRVRYSKKGAIRFLSHLDTIKILTRAVRRANIPIEYSKGFSEHMKLAFGPPLPLGYTSDAEYMDIELVGNFTTSHFKVLRLNLPAELRPLQFVPIIGKVTSLFSVIDYAAYTTQIPRQWANKTELDYKIEELLSKEKLIVERIKKRVDIKPLIRELSTRETENYVLINFLLSIGSRGTARPDEIMFLMGFTSKQVLSLIFHRTELLTKSNSSFRNPLGEKVKLCI